MNNTISRMSLTIIEQKGFSTFLGDMLEGFEGENQRELDEMFNLGVIAENIPNQLTPYQAFKVSFLLERLELSARKSGRTIIANKLEDLKHIIMDGLRK